MSFGFVGARALVTGASSGIGEELAVRLAAAGAHVALLARREAELERVADRCRSAGVDAHVVPVDLGDSDAARRAAADASGHLGGVDLLVNNAGVPRRVHASRLSFEQLETTMRVNYLGAMAVTWAVLPGMLEAGRGRIVNISSIAGRLPAPRELAYAASKAALTMASEVLASDLRGTGVAVHVVTPGIVDTPLWEVEGQEPAPPGGGAVPASAVVDAVFRLLETGAFEAFVPRRYRPAHLAKALLGGRFVAATAAYDRRKVPGAYRGAP